jgi:hypothetical protein
MGLQNNGSHNLAISISYTLLFFSCSLLYLRPISSHKYRSMIKKNMCFIFGLQPYLAKSRLNLPRDVDGHHFFYICPWKIST